MRVHAIDLLRTAREQSSEWLTLEIDRQLDGLIESVPRHLLPVDDSNIRRSRGARRTAPVPSGQAL
jgi:hypothetical protein